MNIYIQINNLDPTVYEKSTNTNNMMLCAISNNKVKRLTKIFILTYGSVRKRINLACLLEHIEP